MTDTTLRNATLEDLVAMLREQHDIKYDIVVPASELFYHSGNLTVENGTTTWDTEGVTEVSATLVPTRVFEDHVSQKFGIPRKYIDKMRSSGHIDLLSHNVNTWLHDNSNADKQWFIRGFLPYGERKGIARALLSDRYQIIDHIDTLTAALDGIARCDTPTKIGRTNLTEKQMYVEIEAPEVAALAPRLLEGYRSPFTGQAGADNPLVFAGFVLSNSEVGAGAFTLTPRLVVQVCNNGMTMKVDAMRRIHLGNQMDTGTIRWSEETRHHHSELVKHQVRDAVSEFLSQGYLESKVQQLESFAEVTLPRPTKTIERVTSELRYSQEETDAVLDLFILSGDARAVGVMHAVTAMAQGVDDADRAYELEGDVFKTLELAVRYA